MSKSKQKVVYVTSSQFKREENDTFVQHCKLSDGTLVQDSFEFDLRNVPIKEILEVDLRVMVSAEVTKAYAHIRIPCIVEHAGLIFDEYKDSSYPGGLTKPMWDTLGNRFIEETKSAGRRAIARAVVAYCDGMSVKTFVGETQGTLASKPKGSRKFYWDTVFIPDTDDPNVKGKTYAEIVGDPALGLRHKMEHLSQSAKAMRSFLDHIARNPGNSLWPTSP